MQNIFRKNYAIILILLFIIEGCLSQHTDFHSLDEHLGTHITSVGDQFVIGKSTVRYFLMNSQTLDYRGLYKINDSTLVAYNSILKIDSTNIEYSVRWRASEEIPSLEIEYDGKRSITKKSKEYSEKQVHFSNGDINLSGTVLLPNNNDLVPGVVLVHGSGSQDRNGYASYIRIIADHLAKRGIAVLIYDKRGCGESTGNWESASFQDLAEDALEGTKLLKSLSQVDENKVGLGGSSQAGWVFAKAVNSDPEVPFVFCISGAGMGISAAKQNIYNNLTELKARGADQTTLNNAEASWNALYKYIETADVQYAKQLDLYIEQSPNEAFLDFFAPPSTLFSLDKKEYWFQTLEVNYDPLLDWQNYQGHVFASFGELDASTPVDEVQKRLVPALESGKNQSNRINIYPKSSHLILKAMLKSDSEFGNLKRFHPYFLSDMSNWILKVTGKQSEAISNVLSLEKQWLEAYENQNAEVMNEIIDENFLITFPNGMTQTKQKILSNQLDQSSQCQNMKLYTTKTSAIEFDHIVILRGLVTTECTVDGHVSFYRQRYTDTYYQNSGKWKVVASHLSNY